MIKKEWSSELPKSWVCTTLGDIQVDRSRSTNPMKMPDEMFELYSVPSFEEGKPEIVLGKEIGSNKIAVEDETVLLCKINPRINRVWVVNSISQFPKIASTEWIPFFKLGGLNPKYLSYFMRNSAFRNFLASNVSGVGGSLMRVRPATFSKYPFPLAPSNEQDRVVAKVEELLSFLDAGVASLRKVQTQLKRYRQAILKYAFEGKLTEEWRRTHKDQIEPAQKTVERCELEKKRDLKHKELPKVDLSGLTEIPESWNWTRIGNLFDVGSGGTPSRRKPEYWKGNIPWVSSGEVAFCEIRNTKECITEEGLENSSAKFYPPGTVLMALYGEGKTRGQAAILRVTATTNQAVACILCGSSLIPPEYVYWWLFYRYYETRRIREGANQPNMYLHHVRKMVIPIAPLLEQKEIVLRIEENLSLNDAINRIVSDSLFQAERLRQSVLKTAFEGKLVSQNPSDEPASRLLERIRAESIDPATSFKKNKKVDRTITESELYRYVK